MPFRAVYPDDPFLDENERQLRDVLKRVTYRPGWKLEVEHGLLRVYMNVIDSTDQGKTIPLTFGTTIPRQVHRDFDWVMWLFEQIKIIEIHEAQEFFRIDGECVYDPHPELAKANEFDRLRGVPNVKI